MSLLQSHNFLHIFYVDLEEESLCLGGSPDLFEVRTFIITYTQSPFIRTTAKFNQPWGFLNILQI